jgi:hypothetical protein
VRAHWDDLLKKLPGRLGSTLVPVASVGCSTKEGEERSTFYGPKLRGIEGAGRGLAEALEAVSICTALREKGSVSLRKALLATK